ncbi:MAG: peptidylprolyl isomerase [Odoribacteraceae bacterium]|jgi:peptidyl-prolyl cis-trans isomerase SurA|nr:peptidylprolyl isomerase [Odoribacteraceae bacterium]
MRYLFLLLFMALTARVSAQVNMVDKIAAIVGDEIVLKSDIEKSFVELYRQGVIEGNAEERAMILGQILIQKLLLAQAKVDSVFVTDDQVEMAMDSKIKEYLRDVGGSQERLEAIMGKSMAEIRVEMRERIREATIANEMQRKITAHVKSTPSEVRYFYQKLNKDSLPDAPARYEIQQIVVKPKVSDPEKEKLRNRLREFRDQVLSGETTFSSLAVLYSEDDEYNIKGGELGYRSKTQFSPEFAEAAFSLKPGRISKIVETEQGFHIIQYIDRQGELINVRHILLRPKIDEQGRKDAIEKLDSVLHYINEKNIPFEYVAEQLSDDKSTRNNGGLIINEDSDSKLLREQVRGEMARQVNLLKVGEISSPFMDNSSGREEYKIIKLKAFYPEHQADLDNDWSYFENRLQQEKIQAVVTAWIKEKQASTYIHIDEEYRNEKLRQGGWLK